MTSIRARRPWVGPPLSAASSGWALLPLRAFLGGTFTFAGLQKLANPGFFDSNNPTSIEAQLKSAAHTSPIHGLIGPLQHVGVAVGVVIALAELAVGLGTLLGLCTRVAALGGMVLSLSLFLTISFHSSPYYTGSDIVFFFAWLPLLVAGSGGVLSVDAFLAAAVAPHPRPDRDQGDRHELDRRAFALKAVAVGTAGALGVLLAGLAAGIGRLVGHYTPAADAGATRTIGGSSPKDSSPTTPRSKTPPGRNLGPATAVTVGQAAIFNDPRTGDPAVVVQPQTGTFVAFDAICPHQGCTVAYVAPEKLFVCPCHGSRFNGETGALVNGPATRGLSRITIAEGPDGDLYAV